MTSEKSSTVDLQELRDFLRSGDTTVEEVADHFDASKRAAKRALQYLVHLDQADYEAGVYS